jgi:hypothetical protein
MPLRSLIFCDRQTKNCILNLFLFWVSELRPLFFRPRKRLNFLSHLAVYKIAFMSLILRLIISRVVNCCSTGTTNI